MRFYDHSFGLWLMGVNFNGSGPVYFEVGLMIFFDFLCSII